MGADVYSSNGRDVPPQRFSAHSTIRCPTLGKFATRSSFSEPRGMECGHCGEDERKGERERKTGTGHLPSVVASRGCVRAVLQGHMQLLGKTAGRAVREKRE